MLISGPDLIDVPIMSLQTGTEIARTSVAVVNPHNLSIAAFEVAGPNLDNHPSLLRVNDIRELSGVGMIVDSSDEFVVPEDIIKLNEIYEINFELIGKPVLNEKRQRLGKVDDFNVDVSTFLVEQINVQRPFLQSFNDPELLVHRSQIIEVTDEAIVIKEKADAAKPLPKSSRAYMNPFRQNNPQPEAINNQHQ